LKIVSFRASGARPVHTGALLEGQDEVLDFDAPGSDLPDPGLEALAWFDLAGRCLPRAQQLWAEATADPERVDALRAAGAVLPRTEVQLVAPVPRPGKVICIGLNYRDHALETKAELPAQPLLFSKFPTAVVGPGAAVRLPPDSERSDYEAELCVVIGRLARRVPVERAFEHVLGYANFNDVSERSYQFSDGQWQRGKSCDTFAPLGEYVATTDEVPDPHRLKIRLRLNGRTMQDSSTDQLIFGVPALVAYISRTITLEPGDLIATGTPPGVGFARRPPVYLKAGDVMEVEIAGLGVLRNPVVAD
jgi:2-keto-4-pentenoate hydratase/2-oxohepta-3-ene-1,7-dioic acid hydratase in catechol pathway